MKKIILLMLVILACPVYADDRLEFIQEVASVVYYDCRGDTIFLKEDSPISFRNMDTNETIPGIDWPYTLRDITTLIRKFDTYEWNIISGPIIAGNNFDGQGIIYCGDNSLDISGDQYYWNENLLIPSQMLKDSFLKIGDHYYSRNQGMAIMGLYTLIIIVIVLVLFILLLKGQKRFNFGKSQIVYKRK